MAGSVAPILRSYLRGLCLSRGLLQLGPPTTALRARALSQPGRWARVAPHVSLSYVLAPRSLASSGAGGSQAPGLPLADCGGHVRGETAIAQPGEDGH